MSLSPRTRVSREYFERGFAYYQLVTGILPLTLLLASLGCTLQADPTSTTENVRIAISPASVVLQPGAHQLFTASVINTADTRVVWTANSGSISQQGGFIGPNVGKTTTVTVTAAIMGDAATRASAAVTVIPGNASLAITTASLPMVSSGIPYSTSISVAGGQTPYQWNLSGSLPSGLVLDSSSGLISGTTTQTGSFTLTAHVTDAAGHVASQSLVVQVSSAISDTGYDGPAELPRVYMQTAVAETPSPGATVTVSAGGDLQQALDTASCGDTVELAAGATFTATGGFRLPAKSCDDSRWITLRTSAPDTTLPAEGTRINPCYAGITSLHGLPLRCGSTEDVMAKIVGQPPILIEAGANHYRLIGLELTQIPGKLVYSILDISDTSDHIVVDRCWVHGTTTDSSQQGLRFNSSYLAVVDSFISDIHFDGADSQAVGGAGGTGPYKIVNNYLEAAGENIMFGGAAATTTPSDIEIRSNHFYKPLTWWPKSGTYGGIQWVVKDIFELKNARRVLVEGNIFENMWGTALVITPKNQSNKCPICIASDITFRFNIVRHAAMALSIADGRSDAGGIAQSSQFISIHDDLFDDISRVEWDTGASSWMFYLGACATCQPVHDVTMSHLTVISTNQAFLFLGFKTNNPLKNLTYTDNIQQNGLYGLDGCGTSLVTLSTCASGVNFTGNVIVGGSAANFTGTNAFPSSWNVVDFTNYNNGNDGNYLILPSSLYAKPNVYGGASAGADINTLNAETAGVSQW